jgi:hypothetical protein
LVHPLLKAKPVVVGDVSRVDHSSHCRLELHQAWYVLLVGQGLGLGLAGGLA